MTTLRIDNLNHSKELDASAMATVSGGSIPETVGKVANAVADGIALGLGLLTGGCEISSTGKSIVCY
ncbi:MAG: hypothetical protein ACLQO1_00805 [Steroidobacteraceae bacterium]